jgi:hypothetical protein
MYKTKEARRKGKKKYYSTSDNMKTFKFSYLTL